MQHITLKHILKIMQDAFNTLDTRLIGHGNQVAYILWKMLDYSGTYTKKQILDLCALAVFHDIGAYKTEELNALVKFEVVAPYYHAIYGSLFIKHFSPLSEMSDIVLYHHLDYINKDKVTSYYLNEAFLLHLADRITILLKSPKFINYSSLSSLADTKFSKEHIALFTAADAAYDITKKILDNSYTEELYALFDTQKLTYEELLSYSKMFAYSIDFRSEYTVYHTITVTKLSELLCKQLCIDEETTKNVVFGALMHDIGKISTPISILEKPGKLTYEEMKIMKNHVISTYNILKDIGFKEIIDIASYHHEKLDGTGYPFELIEDQLSFPVRIVMVADILSALVGKRSYKEPFSKERIIDILTHLSSNGKIDSCIVHVILTYYDELMNALDLSSEASFFKYENIKNEHETLLSYFNKNYNYVPEVNKNLSQNMG